MAAPGDELAAGRGQLRASHADRDQVAGTLKIAFIQGRLTKDEFDLRVGQAFAARTYADLAALTADIPAGLVDTQPPRRPPARNQGWPPLNNGAKTAASVITAALMLTAVLWVIAWFASSGTALSAAIVATGTDIMIIFAAGAQLIESRRQHRS